MPGNILKKREKLNAKNSCKKKNSVEKKLMISKKVKKNDDSKKVTICKMKLALTEAISENEIVFNNSFYLKKKITN